MHSYLEKAAFSRMVRTIVLGLLLCFLATYSPLWGGESVPEPSTNVPNITSAPTVTPSFAQVGQVASFNIDATSPSGAELTYAWDFGDGSSGVGLSCSHVFNSAGDYTVTVSVSDDKDSVKASVKVNVILSKMVASKYIIDSFGVKAISGGGMHFLALNDNGTILASGRNESGEIGNGKFQPKNEQALLSCSAGFASVNASLSSSLAIANDSSIWAWGDNLHGELGLGNTVNQSTPVQIPDLYNIVALAGGDHYSLALAGDGTIWAWGANESGELGDGTNADRYVPEHITSISGVMGIAAYGNCSLAVKDDGSVLGWGPGHSIPAQLNSLDNIIAVSTSAENSLALRNDGTVWSWGDDDYGQLGNGTVGIQSYFPLQVSGLNNVVAVACGDSYSLALKSDGTVWAWGYAHLRTMSYKINKKRLRASPVPVQVQGLSNILAINASGNQALVLKDDGTVWGWGRWNGKNNFSSKPVLVVGPKKLPKD